MINYDSSKEPEVIFHAQVGGVFWAECEVCLYDGEWEPNVTKEYALRVLKDHNHYPEVMNERIEALEKKWA